MDLQKNLHPKHDWKLLSIIFSYYVQQITEDLAFSL